MIKLFSKCSIIMGDYNLCHRSSSDMAYIEKLCESNKYSALNEITRSRSNNQLDYILILKDMKDQCYSTSYSNFISDHKTITVRMGLEGNILSDETRERITFDSELHLNPEKRVMMINQR